MCMTFYRRDGHVIEVQTGNAVSKPEEACSPRYFQQRSIPFLTLVSEYNPLSFSATCAFLFSPSVSSTKFAVACLMLLKCARHLFAYQRAR